MADSKAKTPVDGVVSREDHGKFELVKGMHGEVAVVIKPAETLTDEERVAAHDLILENSAPGAEDDPRHSAHPDYVTPDGSPADGSDNVINVDTQADKDNRSDNESK